MDNIRDLVFGIFGEGIEKIVDSEPDDFEKTELSIPEGIFCMSNGIFLYGNWQDSHYEFEGQGFKLTDSFTCDGIEQLSVHSHGMLVYKDDSYDGSKPRILTYIPGAWENRLRELSDRISEEQLSLF
ncbi:MAG: hypothetical protein U1B79_01725 [Candidatus Pacearchaeota archaeon]|nr:hypothetical protein [Nanoarchaeota archaeon]MDZ4226806.1 hypothetical protein [Candidatus Pacearchaeota archaeon]